ncbi:hypothetical protein TL18_04415 [Methanobrevibacter sp. YE315]|uniref:ion channel n=1 Tax=Methanobrevibacter sp. YE315 TaxID=1609968 RepID=UPI000764DB03|nr:ion channel [Methanobrevibacter sp. YE315]AMD17333.1 hypothetical protein TL18_04415 [Methanobrevibacter sp. YE315]
MALSLKVRSFLYTIMDFLILSDLILIVISLFSNVSIHLISFITVFDVFVCIILLFNIFYKFYQAKNKKRFIKKHILDFIASVPFELVLPVFILLRFLLLTRLFDLFRYSKTFGKYFSNLNLFFENTKMDILLRWIIFVVIIFTFTLYFLDPGLNIFESLWFVLSTLTTVGYGDITPNTQFSKFISLVLLILGIFIFSTFTGAISSYFTDKILNIDSDVEDGLAELSEKVDKLENELADINGRLELANIENQKLHEKIDELLKK